MKPVLSQSQPQPLDDAALEKVIVQGRLEHLTPKERLLYYKTLCESLGLNPLTRPFEYITLSGRLTLYARRDATDQLRRLHQVSITIVSRERLDDIYVVTARATLPDGRCDEATGAVCIAGLSGEQLANAIMKCETKAKRRVTLSIVGLGILDESELDTVSQAQRVTIDDAAAEVVEPQQLEPSSPSQPNNDTTVVVTSEPPAELTFGDAYEEEVDKVMLDECNQMYEQLSDIRKAKFKLWLQKTYGKTELFELNILELAEVHETLLKTTRTTKKTKS
jgi:hypothetical protein